MWKNTNFKKQRNNKKKIINIKGGPLEKYVWFAWISEPGML